MKTERQMTMPFRKHCLTMSAPAMPMPPDPPSPGPGSYQIVDYKGPSKKFMSRKLVKFLRVLAQVLRLRILFWPITVRYLNQEVPVGSVKRIQIYRVQGFMIRVRPDKCLIFTVLIPNGFPHNIFLNIYIYIFSYLSCKNRCENTF